MEGDNVNVFLLLLFSEHTSLELLYKSNSLLLESV